MGDTRLSIITINRNNAVGLEKTLLSINAQTGKDFEHIIIDGASDDGSVDVIKKHDNGSVERRWVSEPDTGIYNAMNKGIRMAKGEYLQFLNSGDCLVDENVTEKMIKQLMILNENRVSVNLSELSVITGGMRLCKNGKKVFWNGKNTKTITFETLYSGSVNHSSSYIKKCLFDKYGLYDESLKIVSDWKFFLNVLILHNEPIEFVQIPVTLFDLSGISSINLEQRKKERREVLQELIPKLILADYDRMYPVYVRASRIMKSAFGRVVVDFWYRLLNKKDKCVRQYYNWKKQHYGF